MKKKTPGPSALSHQGRKNRAGRLVFPILLLGFLLFGCQGNNDPSVPSLPADVVNVSSNPTTSFSPATAASGDTVYVAWTDQAGAGNFEVFLSRSTNGGSEFGAPVNLSESAAFSGNPRMALSGNSLYIVWEEFITDKNETDIFFRRGDDQNGTLVWDPPLPGPGKNLSPSSPVCGQKADGPCPSQRPAIAVIDNHVFIAWDESTDYVFTFASLNPPAQSFLIINSEILMVHSANNGIEFLPFPGPTSATDPRPKPISSIKPLPATPSLNPALVSANGHLYVAWEDFVQPNTKILFRRMPDPNNGSFTPPLTAQGTILSGSILGATRPSLAAEGETILLGWEGFASLTSNCPLVGTDGSPLPNSEIFMIRSSDGGVTFEPSDPSAGNLSNTLCGSNNAKIAFSGNAVHAVWEDNTPGITGISFRKSVDGGTTFGSVENLSRTAGSASNPAVAASGLNLFAFWEDSTLGNLEVVFARR